MHLILSCYHCVSYQWLQSLQVLDSVSAEVEVREHRAALEDREAAADSVVAEVEPLERRQLREPLQRGQPDVDEAERLEAGVLLVEAFDLRRAGVVQNQFLDLKTDGRA